MHLNRSIIVCAALLISLMTNLTILSTSIKADTGSCGGATTTLPFTDVMGNPFFCQIAAAYFSGLTAGTSATTFSPSQNVNREQMAAFTTRTLDQALKRGSQKAVTKKWWTPQDANSLTLTNFGSFSFPEHIEFDGTDLWVVNTNNGSATVTRIRPSDGKVLDTWTGVFNARGLMCAMGRVFILGQNTTSNLYMIDPTQPAGTVTTLTNSLGTNARGIAFDGSRIWTANSTSISIVTLNPIAVTTISTGFGVLLGMLYDGANIWVIDQGANTLLKLDSNGVILQTINTGNNPLFPVFDGTNIWVPNQGSNTLTVVRVKDADGNPLATAFVVATLTGNGLNSPWTAAFDGERILVTNQFGNSLSLWKAADLTPLITFSTGNATQPWGACSDGLNFWITLNGAGKVARF